MSSVLFPYIQYSHIKRKVTRKFKKLAPASPKFWIYNIIYLNGMKKTADSCSNRGLFLSPRLEFGISKMRNKFYKYYTVVWYLRVL
jgi:hypothetical protein